ncbi:MAG: glutaredoxin domain-containing protein [Sphingomonas fennica]
MAGAATLYRMATPTHLCPFGLKAKWLLRRRGYRIDDRLLTSRAAQDAFKAEHDVATTPQVFIGGRRIGGYDDLRRHFGLPVRDPQATSYRPVVAVFAVAALIALAIGHLLGEPPVTVAGAGRFVAAAMMLLAMLKLQDVDRFATMFLGYDLLAQRLPPYAYAYPALELAAGGLMLAGLWPALSIPIAATIGGIGAVSVVKAVYVERRSLKCACVGGGSNVPLGFVSLTENVMMVAMAVGMAVA